MVPSAMGQEEPYRGRIIELERKKDYQGAYALLQDAIALFPTDRFLLRTEVFLLLRLKRLKDARQLAEMRFQDLKRDPFFVHTYFRILEQTGAREDIERLLDGYQSLPIGDERLALFIVKFADRLQGRARAKDMLNQMITDGGDRPALRALARDWEKGGSRPATLRDYREKFKGRKPDEVIAEIETIRILPDYLNDDQLHLFLADLYKKKKDYGKAVEVYQGILKRKDTAFTRKLLGYAYYRAGDVSDALVYLQDALLDDPFDPFLYRTIARIFERKKDYEGLEALVRKVLAKNPGAGHLYGILKKAKQWSSSQRDN